MADTFDRLLREGLDELGLGCTNEAAGKLREFYRLLDQRNRVIDLTAISGAADTVRLHFLDSAALLLFIEPDGKRLVDVGTGAGFPGMPLKLLRPDMRLTLLDSLGKRVDFLREAGDALGLRDVEYVCARAEEFAAQRRESFDIAVSRAVARLNVLCELCLPLVAPGGIFIAMKGPEHVSELAEAESAIAELGGRVQGTREYTIPGTDLRHCAVIIEKLSATPEKYPRRFARIKTKPL